MMRLSAWEQKVSQRARAVHLDSIRNRILAFAIVATLIPAVSMAWLSYVQNQRSLTEKTSEELQGLADQSHRDLTQWRRDQINALKVFVSSYEVTENLARHRGTGRLRDYVKAVRTRFTDYEELLVLDPAGRIVTSTSDYPRALPLPADWRSDLRAGIPVLTAPYADGATKKPVMLLAIPIQSPDGPLLGAFVAKINLTGIQQILGNYVPRRTGVIYILDDSGRVITSSQPSTTPFLQVRLDSTTVSRLARARGQVVDYRGVRDQPVIGVMRDLQAFGAAFVVLEIPAADAYAQIRRMGKITFLVLTGLLTVTAVIAYFLALFIVRPLDRLTNGAAKVAAGDLSVNLPVLQGGEVGYLTEIFNDMVRRLRENREALERLSITDALTSVFNRRRLMETLAVEVMRASRTQHHFAVLLLDVDHFKQYNDTFGHLAGDEVLKGVAALLKDSTRGVDCVARYGGEEFCILLPETDMQTAMGAAERIRARIAGEEFPNRTVTVSVGVAEFPTHGGSVEALLAAADAALYEAKRSGRDRVVPAAAGKPADKKAAEKKTA